MTKARDNQAETHRRAASRRPSARALSFTLRVSSGPDAGASAVVAPGQPGRMLVGQSPVCELRLTDRMVSRRHLALELGEAGLLVSDLDTTNGTRVNGLAIGQVRLCGGEQIKIGETVLDVEADREPTDVPLAAASSFGRLLGASEAMRCIYPLCRQLARSNVSVIIEGETGTGKEVLAEALHEASPRAKGPFVVFDCTTVPANLIESTLFGHVRGAFTGATDRRIGVFEQAHGGTLLLDEIGDLSLDLQAKLLRALERSEVQHVGGSGWVKVDVRILAATRRDLDAAVQEGTFRDDLFYRLAVARIELPPLSRRVGDVELLARHFWNRMADAGTPPPADFLARLHSQSWPGNVRQLQNTVARRVALGDLAPAAFDEVEATAPATAAGLPAETLQTNPFEHVLALGLPLPRARRLIAEEFQRRYLERVLSKHDGNVARAADAAGVARRYFRLLRARDREQRAATEADPGEP